MTLRDALAPFAKFVAARERSAWRGAPDDRLFYGDKYPGHNLTLGDFRRLAQLHDQLERTHHDATPSPPDTGPAGSEGTSRAVRTGQG